MRLILKGSRLYPVKWKMEQSGSRLGVTVGSSALTDDRKAMAAHLHEIVPRCRKLGG